MPARSSALRACLVLVLAAAPRGVQHDPDLDAALLRGDDRVEQRRIGEHEHLDAQRSLARRRWRRGSAWRSRRAGRSTDARHAMLRWSAGRGARRGIGAPWRRFVLDRGAARRRRRRAPAARRGCPARPRRRPCSTMILSASRIVLRRCAIVITVRPFISRSRPSITSRSDSVSSAAVGSSRIRIGALRMIARAMPMRWRWPPDSVTPRSPTSVS